MEKKQIIGILGGGQLGRMLIQSGMNYPINFHVYSDHNNFSSQNFCKKYDIGDLNNFEEIVKFGKECDIITIEIENINIDALKCLRDKYGKKVYPQPEILEMIKDRLTQKNFLKDNQIPTLDFININDSDNNLSNFIIQNKKIVNKLRIGGYDGYGTRIITKENINNIFVEPSIIEKYCEIDKELSVIIVRNNKNEIKIFPPVEMKFNEKNMLDHLICPYYHSDIDQKINQKINKIAKKIASKINFIGILAIEMFLDKEGNLYVNELAPRPHNSGHHTQNMFTVSQFDMLVRCLLDMSLPNIFSYSKYGASLNILGSIEGKGNPVYHFSELNGVEDVYLHLYDKSESKPYRKMGHINILANTLQELEEKIDVVKKIDLIGVQNNVEKDIIEIKNTVKNNKNIIFNNKKASVGIIMGSSSDYDKMSDAIKILEEFHIQYEVFIISAHRTPRLMLEYAESALERGLHIIIAGAGGAAHLPGMVASCTPLPVIGVPIKSSNSLDGWDSILSILQMPGGVPVATVGLNNSKNAGLLAVKILGKNEEMIDYMDRLKEKVYQMNDDL